MKKISNNKEFCMAAINDRTKCPKVSLPIIISFIIKTFKYLYLFLNIWRVSSLRFLYPDDFNPDLTGRWNAECNVGPLPPLAAFPVDAVKRTDDWLRLWFGYLRTHFKYSVIAVIKKLFSTPPPSLKNGLGGNLIFYSANLQCNIYCIIKLNRCCWPSLIWEHISKSCSLGTNKLPNIVDTIAPLLTLSLSSKTRSSKLRFIFENSAVTSSSSNWTKLMFHISS